MSLQPMPIAPVPEETVRIARAAFPKGNLYLTIRDEVGTIYTDETFADLFPAVGQPAQAPWRLALVTVFQFLEGLSDRQAAEAVRSRIDWKYGLGLELSDAGFDASLLCEFRARLLAHEASERLLDVLLEQCKARGWRHPRVANSAPTPRMCWRPFACSTAWNWWARPCGPPWRTWRRWLLTG